jgi:hypothetical protein
VFVSVGLCSGFEDEDEDEDEEEDEKVGTEAGRRKTVDRKPQARNALP